MKYLITTVLMVCLAVSIRCAPDTSKIQSNKQPQGNYKEKKIPPGLKSRIVTVYVSKSGIDTLQPSKKHIYNYDKTGLLTEWITYNEDGSLLTKFISRYDEKGNEIEVDGYDKDGSLYHKNVFKYDEKGNRTERLGNGYKGKRTPNSKDVYKYDENNKLKEMASEIDGFSPIVIKIIYNERGERIEDDWYQGDKQNRKVVYKYDEKGDIIEQAEVFLEHNITSKTVYKYSAEGYPSEEIHYSSMESETISMLKRYEYEFYHE